MFESRIIQALNESKKAKFECDDVDQVEVDDVVSDDDVEECGDMDEVIRKVRGGKVVKLKKPPKKGYKVIDGKYVKMSSKEKMARRKAIKKAQRKAHSGGAKLARRKSMKLRARKNLNSSFKFDEQAFQELMNASLDNIFESVNDRYYSFTVESVDSAVFDGSNLVLECSVEYEDGVTASSTFTVEDFDYTSGTYEVTESSNLLDEIRGSMTVELVVEGAEVIPVEFSHDVNVDGEQMSESFVFESVKIQKAGKWDVYMSPYREKLPSGDPALVANINDEWAVQVAWNDEGGIYILMEKYVEDDDDYEGYYLRFHENDEDVAVAKFMSMAKFINPKNFDPAAVARKFGMDKV